MTINLEAWLPYSLKITAAKTDFALSPAVGTGQRFEVMDLYVDLSSAAAAAACRIGFGTANTPGQSATEATPTRGTLFDSDSLAAGMHVPGIPGTGLAGEELRITCGAPTGGSLIVTFLGRTIS